MLYIMTQIIFVIIRASKKILFVRGVAPLSCCFLLNEWMMHYTTTTTKQRFKFSSYYCSNCEMALRTLLQDGLEVLSKIQWTVRFVTDLVSHFSLLSPPVLNSQRHDSTFWFDDLAFYPLLCIRSYCWLSLSAGRCCLWCWWAWPSRCPTLTPSRRSRYRTLPSSFLPQYCTYHPLTIR